jgi:Thioredoxin domain
LTFQPTGRCSLAAEVKGRMEKGRRQVEVFTAGCPVCDPTVSLVNDLACPDCEVTIYDLRESGVEKAREHGIRTVPAVVVDGRLAACCDNTGPRREVLEAADIGQRL